KLQIAYDLNAYNDKNSYDEIVINESAHSLIQSISQNNMQSIQDTLSVLSEEEVDDAVGYLQQARKSLFTESAPQQSLLKTSGRNSLVSDVGVKRVSVLIRKRRSVRT